MKINDIFNEIIIDAINEQISDIHFNPSETICNISFRSNLGLELKKTISIEIFLRLIRYVKFKCKLDPALTNYIQDGSFIYKLEDNKYYLRISTIKLLYNESLVIRIIYQNIDDNKFNCINYKMLNDFFDYISNNVGLYIFTGPTGSGKTSAMYHILNRLVDQFNLKVITIEDPVEIVNDKFSQIQVNEDINLNYPTALKAALRQDPDFIMIGEIRDETTARNVFKASLTGHSVITTMHTKNKFGVIERFIDFGFHKSEIDSILKGISNQRLLNYDGTSSAFFDFIYGDDIKNFIISGEDEDDIYGKAKSFKNK